MSADVVQSNGNATSGDGLPPLAALFLIKFDLKIGYTISWKRSLPGVDLDGAVEFKSLPSGLHSVKEDLVYFIHEQYVGLSSFINCPASEEERNAHLVAVGILVPLSQGRLGRSWLHAQNLNELARILVNDTTQTDVLEEYWTTNNATNKQEPQDAESPAPSSSRSHPKATRKSSSYGRSRGLSNVTAFHPKHETLGTAHPALSIMKYIDTFGPLVFPLVRAALLRKRILFITPPPVRLACEFVYDLCILSTIPSSVTDALPPGSEPLQRLRSLFAVGVHDIPRLEGEAKKHDRARDSTDYSDEDGWSPGWAACTTDEVLAMKTNLYDIVVELPVQVDSSSPQEKCWPRIKDFRGREIKATQRDLRRFRILHHELRKTQRSSVDMPRNEDDDESDDGDQAALLSSPTPSSNTAGEEEIYADSIVEPYTWSELAYAGFMWWASAGEQDTNQSEEGDRDRALLGDLSDFVAMSPGIRQNSFDADTMAQSWYNATGSSAPHTAIIAYFHRLTGEVFHALADIVDAADDEEDDMDDEREKRKVEVHGEDVRRMGLDGWSEVDKAFVKEVLRMYFGRRAEVHGASVECCGIKIC